MDKTTNKPAACLAFAACLLLIASCLHEPLDTNQVGSYVITLKSFGPCPIARGAELRIIGANMDKVQSVVIPGAQPVTDIKRISPEEIRITVPPDAEKGRITLRTPEGDITSLTEITYRKSISIEKLSPLKVRAGDLVTIEGDDLDLVEEVIFAGDVHVRKAAFAGQSRNMIRLSAPREARSGKLIASDRAEESGESGIPLWVYSTEELNVALPVIASLSPQTVKTGKELTVSGNDLDLVKAVRFGGDTETSAFRVDDSHTALTVKVHEQAQDGLVRLLTWSGLEVESREALTLVLPAVTGITPEHLEAGGQATFTGTDLDLVREITFSRRESAGTTGVNVVPGGDGASLTVQIPPDATTGNIVLTTTNGSKVSAGVTAIHPPVAGSVTDPVTDPSLLIFSFDESDWLPGALWNGVGTVGDPAGALSGVYYEITASTWSAGYWWFRNNREDFPSIPSSNYVVKMDVRLRRDIPADDSDIRLRIAGKEANFLPYLKRGDVWTTYGEWTTVTLPLSAFGNLSYPTPAEGEWGIVAVWLVPGANFTGFCIDNIRYEKTDN